MEVVFDPYESVDWSEASHYWGQFHTHSYTQPMHESADDYYDAGCNILGYYNDWDHIWPWTEWDEMEERDDWGDPPESRDPDEDYPDMLAIEGVETGGSGIGPDAFDDHHVSVSFGYETSASNLYDRVADNADAGLFCLVPHPHRHGHQGDYDRYLDVFEDYPETYLDIWNMGTSRDTVTDERLYWNTVQHFAPDQPVFAAASDDDHNHNAGYDFDVAYLVVLADNLAEGDVQDALEVGETYCVLQQGEDDDAPEFESIDRDGTSFDVGAPDGVTVEWWSGGRRFETGDTIDLGEYEDDVTNHVVIRLVEHDECMAQSQPFLVKA